jgi:hypothetical protein
VRREAARSYLLLKGRQVVHWIRKDPFDPLSDAERVTTWLAERLPAVQRYRRPRDP